MSILENRPDIPNGYHTGNGIPPYLRFPTIETTRIEPDPDWPGRVRVTRRAGGWLTMTVEECLAHCYLAPGELVLTIVEAHHEQLNGSDQRQSAGHRNGRTGK